MSLRVGLGASQDDLEVQGEIDFDFFEESNCSSIAAKQTNAAPEVNHMTLGPDCSDLAHEINSLNQDANICNGPSSVSSYDFNQPVITISCDNNTGAIQKTIKTVIPTPFNYKDNKCGKKSPSMLSRKVAVSPRFKSKVFKDDNDGSDDSSISSMSESESDMSSVSADSFELNEEESDSMTDVSPLPSPFQCSTPNSRKLTVDQNNSPPLNIPSDLKKDRVKFTDDVENMADAKPCPKCDTIDIHELVRAMKRLKMKQNINSDYVRKCKSPVTHNARCRKNLSFSNEEVRRIDNDNQVLLKKIIAQQNRVTSLGHSSPRITSAATVNRNKQQRQIELENLVRAEI